jgi:hypothetical protein
MGQVSGFPGFNTNNIAIPMAVQMAVPTVDIARHDILFHVSGSKQSAGITERISDAFGNVLSDKAFPFKPEKAIPDKSTMTAAFSDGTSSTSTSSSS